MVGKEEEEKEEEEKEEEEKKKKKTKAIEERERERQRKKERKWNKSRGHITYSHQMALQAGQAASIASVMMRRGESVQRA